MAKAKIWYWAIRKLSGWSDYKLDKAFAYSSDLISRDITGTDRPRVFERIRTDGKIPIWRGYITSEQELVERVSNHSLFRGMREIYESPFWDIVKRPPSTLRETNSIIESMLESYGLTRLPIFEYPELMEEAMQSSEYAVCNRCMTLSLSGLSPLERLTLLALLCREADFAGNTKAIELTRNHFDSEFDRFCHQYLEYSLALEVYYSGTNDFLFGERQTTRDDPSLRQSMETRTGWPIISLTTFGLSSPAGA